MKNNFAFHGKHGQALDTMGSKVVKRGAVEGAGHDLGME